MYRRMFFWSIFLLLAGSLLLIRLLFNLSFNWFGSVFAILLLQSGVWMLFSGSRKKSYRREGGLHMLMTGKIIPDYRDREITVCFADAEVDLPSPLPAELEITSIFANTLVRLPEGWSVRAECSAAFGLLQTPEGSVSGFGERVFIVGSGQQCRLQLHTVFGQLILRD